MLVITELEITPSYHIKLCAELLHVEKGKPTEENFDSQDKSLHKGALGEAILDSFNKRQIYSEASC